MSFPRNSGNNNTDEPVVVNLAGPPRRGRLGTVAFRRRWLLDFRIGWSDFASSTAANVRRAIFLIRRRAGFAFGSRQF